MKKSFLTISFILFCVVCVAQNTANKYLADAKKALAEGHYDRAQKLAAVYNQLAGSNRAVFHRVCSEPVPRTLWICKYNQFSCNPPVNHV